MTARRSSTFGHVERLASGKTRARYSGPDGLRRSQTFATVADARAWLATVSADMTRRAWRAPEDRHRTIGAYAADYLARDDLRPSTRALYASTWRLHLAPTWQDVSVDAVTSQRVRAWHAAAARTTAPTALAQAYRLLRAILNVAVDDDAIPSNPCRLRSAGSPAPATPARSLTAPEVVDLAAAMPARYKALVLVLGFGGLRFGEATALRRCDVSDDGSRVDVARSVRYLDGGWHFGPTKTGAGRRTVALPAFVADAVVEHLAAHVPDDDEALVFGTRTGVPPARSNFGVTFRRAVASCGLPPTRVHWLRHTGATLAAATPGVSTADLQRRLGHSSPAAALRYQHAVNSRDDAIARALHEHVVGKA